MKITMAQLDPFIGDINGNLEKIIKLISPPNTLIQE